MLCEWEVGNEIRCIDDRLTNGLLKKGQVYKIIAIEHEPTSVNMDYVYVGTKGQDGWSFRAFELVNKLTQGTKHDEGKLRYDLISPIALEKLVQVLTYGAKEYAPRNWEKGIKFSRVFAAIQRHLWAFWNKDNWDKESKLSHLAHAECCIMFLLHYFENYDKYKDFDDRPEVGNRYYKGDKSGSATNV